MSDNNYDWEARLNKNYLGVKKAKKKKNGNYSGVKLKHLKRLCELPCMFCNAEPGGFAHHVRAGSNAGMGMKPGDEWTIPVCHDCHDSIHFRIGEKKFYKSKGYDLQQVYDKARGSQYTPGYQGCKCRF